ncbi:MAG: SRPBCC family protein [Bacteroidota bacterium]
MKFLKKLFFGILILIGLALIIALFTKKDYAIEREIVINKPSGEVFNYIKYVKNQDNFSVWNQRDTAMKKDYKGEDGTVGFVYAWDSEKKEVGKGEQEIKKITEGQRVDFELRFKEPMEATDTAYMTTTPVSDASTKVKWGFSGRMPYPFNLMLVFMDMDKMIGGDLQSGLNNLKTKMETK